MWIWLSLFRDCISTCLKLLSVDWRGRAWIWLVSIAQLRSRELTLLKFPSCTHLCSALGGARGCIVLAAQQDAVVLCGAGGPAGSTAGKGAGAACLASHSSSSQKALHFARNNLNSVLLSYFSRLRLLVHERWWQLQLLASWSWTTLFSYLIVTKFQVLF